MFNKQIVRNHSTIKQAVIVSAARTPVGCIGKSLASVSATDLGSIAIRGAVQKAGINPEIVQEVYMGNVVSANLGQAPARQAALKAGLLESTICTTINKVCSSGLKAVTVSAQTIALGHQDVIIAGGMESMSNAPYYLEKARYGFRYGHQTCTDGIIKDGLWDSKYQIHMGNCAEDTAAKFNISRQEQDAHAIESYKRAAEAWKKGWFKDEVVPVKIKQKGKEIVVSEDEEYTNINLERVPQLKPAFKEGGTITAANASTLNDGASALLLMSEEKASSLGLKPLAKIISYADFERDPIEFPIAPAYAIPKALKLANLSVKDISLFEINEAFSVVIRANEKILSLDPSKVNIAGGGVSLGHPIGSSGSRILVSLVHLLKSGQLGCAAICNGGGGATALIVERY